MEEAQTDLELVKLQQKETSEYLRSFHEHFTLQMKAIDASSIKEYKSALNDLLEQIDAIKLQFVHLSSAINRPV